MVTTSAMTEGMTTRVMGEKIVMKGGREKWRGRRRPAEDGDPLSNV
jgi:hypothetical protein